MISLAFRPLVVAMTVVMAYSLPVYAQSAGTVVFAQDGVQIIGTNGQARPARQGDVLQTGERIQTPANGITQLKLPDGSLMGLRSNAELRVDPPAPGSGATAPEMTLFQGSVRVVGAELVDKTKTSSLILKAGQTSVQLTGADIESAVLKPDARQTAASGEAPGTYNRLTTGSAILRSGGIIEPLPVRQVSFVPANSPVPSILATIGPTVFASTRPQAENAGASVSRPGLVNMTSTLTAPRLDAAGSLRPTDPAALPVFSPLSTGAPNPQPGDRPISGGATAGAASTGMAPTGMRPPPPPPVAIMPPIRPPVICRPNPIAGHPPICT